MPGQFAKIYVEKYGGIVQYLGKPYQTVYDACFTVLSSGLRVAGGVGVGVGGGVGGGSQSAALDKSRICGVGDSLDHDILGAHTAGISR